ncbi:MAG: hypothetical protein M3R55_10105 [Acidobacteriota bacterium]|nr:hypothetical protein [Acidobacteriota bacterium]
MRFFRVVDPLPRWMVVLTLPVSAYAAGMIWIDAANADEGLAMLLLWQMLCASKGFARAARLGQFDPVLVRFTRAQVACAHGIWATLPVSVLWAALAALEAVRWPGTLPAALEPGRVAALAFTSAASWALSVPGSRLVTGSLWLVVIIAAATTRVGLDQYSAMLSREGEPAAQVLHALALVIVCPFLMIGNHVPARLATAGALVVCAAAAAACGVLFVQRRQYVLEPGT